MVKDKNFVCKIIRIHRYPAGIRPDTCWIFRPDIRKHVAGLFASAGAKKLLSATPLKDSSGRRRRRRKRRRRRRRSGRREGEDGGGDVDK